MISDEGSGPSKAGGGAGAPSEEGFPDAASGPVDLPLEESGPDPFGIIASGELGEEGLSRVREEWLFVLAAPITQHRDKIMLIEADGMSFAPVFRSREDGSAVLVRLAPDDNYAVQAMHRKDIRDFARSQNIAALILDSEGKIVTGLDS
jgi:hypothetical protein